MIRRLERVPGKTRDLVLRYQAISKCQDLIVWPFCACSLCACIGFLSTSFLQLSQNVHVRRTWESKLAGGVSASLFAVDVCLSMRSCDKVAILAPRQLGKTPEPPTELECRRR